MRDTRTPPLELTADLRVQVTATTGEQTSARVTGEGSTLHVVADDPAVLFSAVSPSDIGRVAELMAEAGIVARVTGPHGPVAVVGAGVRNPVGRVVTGSAHVAPAPRAAARIVAGMRGARVAAGALVVLVAAAWAVVGRNRT